MKLILLLLLLIAFEVVAAIEITETIATLVDEAYGGFEIFLNGKLWFRSMGRVFVRSNGKMYTTEDRSLRYSNITKEEGIDRNGHYVAHTFYYSLENGTIMLKASMTLTGGKLLFKQVFPQQLDGTSANDPDGLISSFPTFEIDDYQGTRGYAHWVSWYYEDLDSENKKSRKLLKAPGFTTPTFGEWNSNTLLAGGIGGTGVTCIFDRASLDSAVLSAYENPMAVSHAMSTPGCIEFGVMGNVDTIPANYSITMILSVEKGVNQAVSRWGKELREAYGKHTLDISRAMDVTLQYLGFTTDNGAYYYYNTEPDTDYGQTLVSVKKYADRVGIPYSYVLLDSWWYYKGQNGGVSNWTAMPSVFPGGIESLYKQTGWYVQAHNRYWAYDNVYATENGGEDTFIMDSSYPRGAVPVGDDFWTKLLSTGTTNWGLRVYEQDWLYNEFYTYVSQMLSSVTLGRDWLLEMGRGAASQGLVIQYCMPYIRQLLQSVEVQVVTQARASDDYVVSPYEGVSNWKIGGQSLLLGSLGLAPSKDGYWSTAYQAGNPYGEDRCEPYARLQGAVTALSTGPIAIGDGIGYSDVDLIMKSCMKNGRTLQPSLPATPIDAYFIQKAFNDGSGPDGEVYFAPSFITGYIRNDTLVDKYKKGNICVHDECTLVPVYGSLLVAELASDWSIVPRDLGCYKDGLFDKAERRLCFNDHEFYVREANQSTVSRWSRDEPLVLKACGQADFALYTIAQIDKKTGWAFLGENDKWASHSPTRFESVHVSEDGVQMVVIATSGATMALNEVMEKNPSLHDVQAQVNRDTLQVRVAEDAEFLGTEDRDERVSVSFVNPDGLVYEVTCAIPAGARGVMRRVAMTSKGDCIYSHD